MCEGGVLVQPTNGREPWRMNWVEVGPGGGACDGGGGGICEVEEEDVECD